MYEKALLRNCIKYPIHFRMTSLTEFLTSNTIGKRKQIHLSLKTRKNQRKKLFEIFEFTLMKFERRGENKVLIGQESWIAKIQSILGRGENEMIKLIRKSERRQKRFSELRIERWQRKKGRLNEW